MRGTLEQALARIREGSPAPIYLLHGDEFLVREGARLLVESLVPAETRMLAVETVSEETDLAGIPLRLRTVSLFGGRKVVVVHESRAFVSAQNAGRLFTRSREAWQAGEAERAVRPFLQGVGAAGEGSSFVERAARGELDEEAWGRVLELEPDPEAERWLRAVAERALADGGRVPEGGGAARVYEELLGGGLPAESVLILTCELVDERRSLFKQILAAGMIIDCGVRGKRTTETQMNLELARTLIRERVAAQRKTIDPEAVGYILERIGLSVRSLVAELDKLLLFVGERERIGAADVAQVLSGSREASIFDLTSAVAARDPRRAVAALRNLLTRREPAPLIVGMLAAEIRGLLLARYALEARLGGQIDPGLSFPAFQSRLLPRLREGQEEQPWLASLLAGHPFRVYNLLRASARFSTEGLRSRLEAVAETDLALKTSGQPEALLLERLLLTLCAA